jgi:hypothetical protein
VIRVDPVSGAQAMVSSVDTSTLLLGIAVVPSSIFQPTDTTLSCGDPVTVGDEARCTATVTAATAAAGTVAFTIDATGTLSPHTCTLAPASGTEATCAVRYTPSGEVPAAGRQDRLTAEFAPEDVTWSASDAETTVTVRARPAPPPAEPAVPANPPATPALSAQALALSCSRSPLVLLSAARSGSRVRLLGAADAANAGQRVTIRTRRGDAVAARATVLPDGSFQATASLPRRRFVRKTFHYAELGGSRSPILKLTRRLTARVKASTGSVTIRGRVSPPLAKRVRPVVIRRLVSCESGFAVVARVRPDARGRFRVSLPRVGAAAKLYRASTRVPHRGRRAGSLRTSALTLRVEPVR